MKTIKDETIPNERMEAEDQPRLLTVLECAMLAGWAVGVMMGTGIGVTVCDYFAR